MEIFSNFISFFRSRKPESIKTVAVSRNIVYNEFFEFPLNFLKWISIDLTPHPKSPDLTENRTMKMMRIIKPWIHLLNMVIYILSIVYDTLQNDSDMFRVTYCVTALVCGSIVISKLALFTIKKEKLVLFIDDLQGYYPKLKVSNNEAINILRYHKQLRICIRVVLILLIIIVTTTPLIVYCYNQQLVMPAPFAKSIFDPTKSFAYPLFYIWEMIMCTQTTLIYFGLDLMVFTMIMVVSLEWLILGRDFRNLKRCGSLTEISILLSLYIERHIKLIKISNTLKKILKTYFAFYILLNGFGIAFSSFRITTVSGITQMTLTNAIALIGMFAGLFMNCFFGQFLINCSEKLAVSVYDCGWERWDNLRMRKTVNIVLMMAQKNVKLTTGFKDVSMVHLYDTLDKSYSYHSLLGDVYGKKLE